MKGNLHFAFLFISFTLFSLNSTGQYIGNEGIYYPKSGNNLLGIPTKVFHLNTNRIGYTFFLEWENDAIESKKTQLEKLGFVFDRYFGNRIWNVIFTGQQLPSWTEFQEKKVRSLFQLPATFKIDTRLNQPGTCSWAVDDQTLHAVISFPKNIQPRTELEKIAQILALHPQNGYAEVKIPFAKVKTLANLDWVLRIEPIHPPFSTDNLPGVTFHQANIVNQPTGRNLDGTGVRVGEWDGGAVGPHMDYDNRKIILDSQYLHQHAAHVAGTILGAGILNYYARGMAPNANLYSSDFYGDIPVEMDSAAAKYDLHLTNNSYGYSPSYDPCPKGNYDIESEKMDALSRKYPVFLHVFSAGNSQTACTGGWRTLGSGYNSAKNVLTVAAVDYKGAMSTFSSWGPCRDGRVKPEISAVGVNVYSTQYSHLYAGGWNGTSMAAPGVTGSIALLYQRYAQLHSGYYPVSSLVKALVCNNAQDGGNAYVDYKYGFGSIRIEEAIKAMEAGRYGLDTLKNGDTLKIQIPISKPVHEMRWMISWTDPEAAAGATKTLVNDIDLWVKTPTGSFYQPWVLDPANPGTTATRTTDTLNNIEQVTLDYADTGKYWMYIIGKNINKGPQWVAYTWSHQDTLIDLTYPIKGEIFHPGESRTLRWQSVSPASTFTISYSTDGGATYTNIASGISSTQRHYDWTIPAASTQMAIIKITDGTLTDSSQHFTIIGWPANLKAYGCQNAVSLTWSAFSGATRYDVYRLSNSTWQFLDSTTTNSYVDTQVTLGNTYWYTFKAVHSSGAVTEYAYAASAQPQILYTNLITTNKHNILWCGDSITLTGPAGAIGYLWTGGKTTSSLKVYSPGTYSLEVTWPGGCKAISSGFTIESPLRAEMQEDSICPGSHAVMSSFSQEYNWLRFTDISQYKTGTGATTPLPTWITGGSSNDYAEVSNLGTDSVHLGEVTFELWNDTLMRKYVWHSSLILPPGRVSVLHIGSSATNDTSNFFFNTGGNDDPSASADPRGYILRWRNQVLDAVAVNGYSFPTLSGVRSSDWTGNIGSMSGRAGVRITPNDYNSALQWALSSAGNPLTLGTLNTGMLQNKNAHPSWSGPNGFTNSGADAIDSFPTMNGQYIVTSATGTCQFSDTSDLYIYNTTTPQVTDGSHCGNGLPICKATGIGTIRWYSDSTGGTLLQTGDSMYQQPVSSNTIWWVSLDNGNCESPRVKISENIIQPPTAQIQRKRNTQNQIELTAQSGHSSYLYSWKATNGISLSDTLGTSITAAASQNGTVTLTAKDTHTYCSYSVPIIISAYQNPISRIQSLKDTLCQGDSILLLADTLSGLGWKSHALRIRYDASQGPLDTASVIYIYSGRADTNLVGSIWKDSVGTWGAHDSVGLMNHIGNNIWEIVLNVPDYYSITTDSVVKYLALRFRNASGSVTGLDTANHDIYIDLKDSIIESSWQQGVWANWIQTYQWYEGNSPKVQNTSCWASQAAHYSLVTYGVTGRDSSVKTIHSVLLQAGTIQLQSDTLCPGDTTQLTLTHHKGQIHWEYRNGIAWNSFGNNDSILNISPSTSTWYRAQIKGSPCQDIITDSIFLYIKPLAQIGQFIYSDTMVCSGDTVWVKLINYEDQISSWEWFDSLSQTWINQYKTSDSIYIITQGPGRFRAGVSKQGCTPVFITGKSIQTYTLPNKASLFAHIDSLCYWDSTWIVAKNSIYGQQNIKWQKFDSAQNAFVNMKLIGDSIYTNSGVYRVVQQSPYCAGSSFSDTLLISPRKQIVISGIQSSLNPVCQHDSVYIQVNIQGHDTLQWQRFDYQQQLWIPLNISQVGFYYIPNDSVPFRVIAWNGCGPDTSQIYTQYVSAPPSPGSLFVSRDTVCRFDTVMLIASAYQGFISWEKDTGTGYFDLGHTTDTLISMMYQSARFRMRIGNAGCKSAYGADHIVTVRPDAEGGIILFQQDTVCEGDTLVLGLYNNVGSSFIWQANNGSGWTNIDTGEIVEYPIFTTTAFRVIAVNYGCGQDTSTIDTLVVSEKPLLNGINASQNPICAGTQIMLTATSGTKGNRNWLIQDSSTSQWNPLNIYADTIYVSPNQSTYYRLELTSPYCTSVNADIFIQISQAPDAGKISLSADSICPGSPVTLSTAGYIGNLSWEVYDSANMQWVSLQYNMDSIMVSPTNTTLYRVLSRNTCGVDSSEIQINMRRNAPVSGNISSSTNKVCIGSAATLTLTGASGNIQWQEFDSTSLSWVNRGGTNTTALVYPYGDIRYRARISRNGCTLYTSEIIIGSLPTPTANISANGPLVFCEGKNLGLQAGTGNGYIYQWQKDSIDIPNANAATYIANTAGKYRVKISNSGGCQVVSSSLTVSVNPAPPIPVITSNGYQLFSSSSTGNQWYKDGIPIPGGTGQTHTLIQKGVYTVRVTNPNNCQSVSLPFTVTPTETTLEHSWQVWPNPVTDQLSIQGTSIQTYRILDASGKLVKAGKFIPNESQQKIQTTDFAPGVYYIELQAPQKRSIFKIVKL